MSSKTTKKRVSPDKPAAKAPGEGLPPPAAKAAWRVPLVIGLILLACYSYFFYIIANWNIDTRLALTHAIVDKHTFAIDDYHLRTQDKAYYNGHYYCDKAVGVSFLGVPVYWAYRQVMGPSEGSQLRRAYRGFFGNHIISLFTTAVPAAIAGVLLYLLLGYFTSAVGWRVWLTLAYGLGTLAFPYATMFFGHQTAAALGFAAFFILFRMRRKGWSPWGALGAGVLAGYSLITDFLSFVVVGGLFIYAAIILLERNPDRPVMQRLLPLLPFCIGVALPLPLQMWHNAACFGSPFASGYQYEVVEKFRVGMSRGFMGITYPRPEAFFQLTFGPRRGLFYESPFLLFMIPGVYIMVRRWRRGPGKAILPAESPYRLEGWLCAGIAFFSILLNSAYYLWWGGAAYGARFAIVAIPFMAVPALFAIPRAPIAFKILAAGSILFTSVVVITTPLIGEISPNPLLEGSFRTLFSNFFMAHPMFNFNLMMYLGVDDLRSVLPLVGLVAICLLYLRSLKME